MVLKLWERQLCSDCQHCVWSSDQHRDHNHHPVQRQQREYEGVYENGPDESKPETIYAQIEPQSQSTDTDMQGYNELTSPNMTRANDAVIYSDLQGIGAHTNNAEPQDALYANV